MDLQETIMEVVKKCPQAMFIFDEVDKMQETLIDGKICVLKNLPKYLNDVFICNYLSNSDNHFNFSAIKPFIDYHESVKGVDFRRSIFIFLSNTGGSEINEIAFQAWTEGRSRESIAYVELEKLVKTGAFNEIGGLHHR